MRRNLLLILVSLLAACSGADQPRTSQEQLQTFDVSEAPPPPASPGMASADRMSSPAGGPAIAPTAAPGVAFSYRYAFRLPAPRIAAVQEQHARFCEQLGIARCRITGMRYRVVNARDIEAMLSFKLEPSIARRVGQRGVEAVAQAEGMLIDSEISGTDAGSGIRAAGRSLAQLNEELRRLETRLGQRGLPAEERARLEAEAQQLRGSIRAETANREEQQESLASTPMVFQYGSGELVPGFDSRPSLRRAAERALDNFIHGVTIFLIVLVWLIPWLLLAFVGWLVAQAVSRRLARRAARAEAEAGPANG